MFTCNRYTNIIRRKEQKEEFARTHVIKKSNGYAHESRHLHALRRKRTACRSHICMSYTMSVAHDCGSVVAGSWTLRAQEKSRKEIVTRSLVCACTNSDNNVKLDKNAQSRCVWNVYCQLRHTIMPSSTLLTDWRSVSCSRLAFETDGDSSV